MPKDKIIHLCERESMPTSALKKLQKPQQPEITTLNENSTWGPAGTSMVISTPQEIDSIMRQVPAQRLITYTELRHTLAKRHGTQIACPLTTGIFARIAAEAATELLAMGQTDVTPFWRTLKPDGVLNEKFPGGIEAQKARLEAEGFAIIGKGKTWRVQNYQSYLFPIH